MRRLSFFHGSISTVFTISIALISVLAPASSAATPEQVDAAIDKAVKHLYDIQKDGIWELDTRNGKDDRLGKVGMHHGGLTAIATLALLASGEKSNDPRLAKALDFLKKLETKSVYVLGVRAQIWPYLGDTPDAKRMLQKDADLIVASMKTRGKARGLFYYPKSLPDQYDHSISQFGVLGLWAAAQHNIEVPTATWELMDAGWRAHQGQDGGWCYVIGSSGNEEGTNTLSMTCAGVATLFITHDYVHAAQERVCNGNVKDENIDRGLKWITDNFQRLLQGGGGRDATVIYYTLYGIERIGVAGGYKYFGETNWFSAGADLLLKRQGKDGAWGGADIFGNDVANVPNTSFGILFLAHGRAPAIINKLSYSAPTGMKPAWNQRPRDVANLTRWTGRQLEHLLNWHIVSLSAPIQDLHDAPILYISGSQLFTFTDEETAKLKQYIDEGGMVLANPDCGKPEFTRSLQKIAAKMYPAYTFRDLPPSHPVFATQQFHADKFKTFPKLSALSNGVRELIVILPDTDPAKTWQIPYQGSFEPYALGADVIEYATDRQGLQEKLGTSVIEPDAKVTDTRTLKLARISYDGNWDPEPAGWKRMSALLHNQFKTGLTVEPVKLGDGKLASYKLAHLTGAAAVTFSAAQIQELKKFVAAGGTLIIDSAGGSAPFADSIEQQFPNIVDATAAKTLTQPLPATDPLYALAKAKIEKFHYRVYARTAIVGKLNVPRLAALSQKGKPSIYYSREDLSAGLVGQEIDGIVGYSPQTATEITRNILLVAAGEH